MAVPTKQEFSLRDALIALYRDFPVSRAIWHEDNGPEIGIFDKTPIGEERVSKKDDVPVRIVICPQCNKEFDRGITTRKYCSQLCYNASLRDREREKRRQEKEEDAAQKAREQDIASAAHVQIVDVLPEIEVQPLYNAVEPSLIPEIPQDMPSSVVKIGDLIRLDSLPIYSLLDQPSVDQRFAQLQGEFAKLNATVGEIKELVAAIFKTLPQHTYVGCASCRTSVRHSQGVPLGDGHAVLCIACAGKEIARLKMIAGEYK